MIDPFDLALSEFIDTLPEDPDLARRLLAENAPFTGRGDLPEFAELATMLRAVPAHQARPEWVAESKARLMSALLLPPEKRGFTWLGTMFLPFSQLSFPSISLPRLSLPSPLFARAAMALVLVAALASVAHQRAGQNPILPVTTDQAPVQNAQQAIAAAQEHVARLADSHQSQVAGAEIQGTPREVVLLSQQIDLADLAIGKAPPADQPRLRSELQSAVRAVRFDGLLEGITNGNTLQVSGVAIQADPATVRQLQVGQPVSLLVTVNGNGKLQAVQAAPAVPSAPPASPAPSSSSSSSPAPSVPSAAAPAPPPPAPAPNGGTAPPTSSVNSATVEGSSTTAAPSSVSPRVDSQTSSDTAARKNRKSDDGEGKVTSTGNGSTTASPPVTVSVTTPGASAAAAATTSGSPGPANVTVTTTSSSGQNDDSHGKSDGSGPSSAVAGATTGSSPVSVTVSSGGSSGSGSTSVQASNSSQSSGGSSQSSSSSPHSVSGSVSSTRSSSSSGQQSSSSQSSESSVHNSGQSAQVSRALAALQTAISSAENHHKNGDHKNQR